MVVITVVEVFRIVALAVLQLRVRVRANVSIWPWGHEIPGELCLASSKLIAPNHIAYLVHSRSLLK